MALIEKLLQDIIKIPGLSQNKISRYKSINILCSKVFHPYKWDKMKQQFAAKSDHSMITVVIISTVNLIYGIMTAMVVFKPANKNHDFGNKVIHANMSLAYVVMNYSVVYHSIMHLKIINFLNSAVEFHRNMQKKRDHVSSKDKNNCLNWNEKAQLAMCKFFRISTTILPVIIACIAVIAPNLGLNPFEILDVVFVPLFENRSCQIILYRSLQFLIVLYTWRSLFPASQVSILINMLFSFIFLKSYLHKLL